MAALCRGCAEPVVRCDVVLRSWLIDLAASWDYAVARDLFAVVSVLARVLRAFGAPAAQGDMSQGLPRGGRVPLLSGWVTSTRMV